MMNEVVETQRKLTILLTHIKNVRDNCEKLGFTLIANGEINLGLELVARGQRHDNSKFYGIEFKHLCDRKKEIITPELQEAIKQHCLLNDHHAESWPNIDKMSEPAYAEMTCDLVARGKEFGRPAKDFIRDIMFIKYGFNEDSHAFNRLDHYHKLLTGQSIT